MTDTQPYAKHGKVHIPAAWDSEFSVGYTPDEARRLARALLHTAFEAEHQQARINYECRNGHTWNAGANVECDKAKSTVYHCTKDSCHGRREEPGWLPFEPKQHVVPYSPKLWDCTGPGCELCADEATADMITAAMRRASNCLPYVGEER